MAFSISDIAEIMDELPADFEFYKIDGAPVSPDFPRLSSRALDVAEGIAASSAAPVGGEKRSGYGDRVVFIFTSGTTGLPKAVPLKGPFTLNIRRNLFGRFWARFNTVPKSVPKIVPKIVPKNPSKIRVKNSTNRSLNS